MISRESIDELLLAKNYFSTEQWLGLAEKLVQLHGEDHIVDIHSMCSGAIDSNGLWLFNQCLKKRDSCSWREIAAAMVTIEVLADKLPDRAEVVWTGPENGSFPVRRFEQVLYDLIMGAKYRILIVTYAAYRADHLCGYLIAARDRGVQLTLVLESKEQSAGQLTFDAAKTFAPLLSQGLEVHYWPRENRECNESGTPGKLHVKCAVVDDCAIVGSGNLTEDAFSRNMEMGIKTNDPVIANSIYEHFMSLIATQNLRPSKTNAN